MPAIEQPLQNMLQQIILFIPRLIVAILIFVIALWAASVVAGAIERSARSRDVDSELVILFGRIGRWSVVIIGTIWALDQVNFNVTAFVAGLGIVGFTIGFALQDIAKNFVAGILLLQQRPFDIGEAIAVSDYSGTVSNISLRATEIRTFDGLLVYIPNADVYTSPLTNYSRVPKRRLDMQVGVAYDTDLDQATTLAVEAVKQLPGVMDGDLAPSANIDQFGGSAINMTLYYWIDMEKTGYLAAKDQGYKLVKNAFQQAGIDIPFPISTVYVKGETGQ